MIIHFPQPGRIKRIMIVCVTLIILCTASWLSYTISHIYAANAGANTTSNVNSLLFGENLILDDQAARNGSPLNSTSDQFASQAYRTSLQQLHVGAIRIPARSSDDHGTTPGIANPQAVIDSAIDTLQMNATPLIILRGAADPQMLQDNGPFMDRLMTAIDNTSTGKNATLYLEFGNEPNINGVSAQQYVTNWNSLLSTLKAKTYASQLKFVGPVINQFDTGQDGSEAYMQTFLNGLTPTTIPDAISWHEYPCTSTPNTTSCNAKIDTNWQNHVALYRQLEKQSIIPNPLPIWITEYNYSSSSSVNDSNAQFQQQWTSQAIQAFAQYGVTAAFHYDVGSQEDLADNKGNFMAEGLGMQDAYSALAAESTPTPTVTSTSTVTPTPTPTITPTPTPTVTPTPTSTPTSTPTPTITPTPNPGSIQFSFEDGTLDGWTKSGNVTKLANSNDVPAEDGNRELEVDFSSRNGGDYPYISVGTSNGPLAGQTLTAYVYVQNSVSVSISAKLFVQDTSGNWHMPNSIIVSTGSWIKLAYVVPTLSGTTNRIGIQFYGDPNNASAKIYVDAVGWA